MEVKAAVFSRETDLCHTADQLQFWEISVLKPLSITERPQVLGLWEMDKNNPFIHFCSPTNNFIIFCHVFFQPNFSLDWKFLATGKLVQPPNHLSCPHLSFPPSSAILKLWKPEQYIIFQILPIRYALPEGHPANLQMSENWNLDPLKLNLHYFL